MNQEYYRLFKDNILICYFNPNLTKFLIGAWNNIISQIGNP